MQKLQESWIYSNFRLELDANAILDFRAIAVWRSWGQNRKSFSGNLYPTEMCQN